MAYEMKNMGRLYGDSQVSKGPFCCWVENRKEAGQIELGGDCKSKLLFKIWAKIFDGGGEKRFGGYLGVKASSFATGLDAWCEETEARMTQFFA